ncbi:hypothetical protein BN2364_3271 [Alloalcanivorax xenomutans]|nr:hypothetical protein BN2364_3271 [Alloalcanivorax xenomutans]
MARVDRFPEPIAENIAGQCANRLDRTQSERPCRQAGVDRGKTRIGKRSYWGEVLMGSPCLIPR